jgi:hypothetical protein
MKSSLRETAHQRRSGHPALCCWSPYYTIMAPDPGETFARGAYTMVAFDNGDDIDADERPCWLPLGPLRRAMSGRTRPPRHA